MKRFGFFLTLAMSYAISNSALAVYMPDDERPVFQSMEASILSSSDEILEVEELQLTMTRRDGSELATGFRLRKTVVFDNHVVDNKQLLRVTSVHKDGCGSITYVAQNTPTDEYHILPIGAFEAEQEGHRVSLILTDHSTRVCKDYKHYGWEAELRLGNDLETVIEFGSNPEPVYSIELYLPTK